MNREVYDVQFTEGVFDTGVEVRLIRCSHADAAESVWRWWGRSQARSGRSRVVGAGQDGTLCHSWHQRSKVEEEAAAI